MQVQEVLRAEVVGDERRRFVAGSGDVEMGETLLDVGLLDSVDLARQIHGTVEPQHGRDVRGHQHRGRNRKPARREKPE
jgi:hypothetical protein